MHHASITLDPLTFLWIWSNYKVYLLWLVPLLSMPDFMDLFAIHERGSEGKSAMADTTFSPTILAATLDGMETPYEQNHKKGSHIGWGNRMSRSKIIIEKGPTSATIWTILEDRITSVSTIFPIATFDLLVPVLVIFAFFKTMPNAKQTRKVRNRPNAKQIAKELILYFPLNEWHRVG